MTIGEECHYRDTTCWAGTVAAVCEDGTMRLIVHAPNNPEPMLVAAVRYGFEVGQTHRVADCPEKGIVEADRG